MKNRILIICSLLLLLPCTGFAHPATDAIKQLGFTQVQSTPPDFTLSDLSQNPYRLESEKGNWILLSFWATWCGPCQMEIPQLEKLHAQLHSRGLRIIGISVDQNNHQGIENFIKRNHITFPILVDNNGQVSRQYNASSIPSLYLISPDFKLVGVLRGAKNWSNADDLTSFAKLLEFKTVPADNTNNGPNTSTETIEQLAPPELSVVFNHVEKILEVSIKWNGLPEKFLIHPPQVELPSSVKEEKAWVSSTAEGAHSGLTYHFNLKFHEKGTFKIGPVTLGFQPRNGGNQQYSRHETIEVTISPSRRPITIFSLMGVVILLSATILVYVAKKKRNKKVEQNDRKSTAKKQDYEALRNMKLNGDPKEYQKRILELYMDLVQENQDVGKIIGLLENIRYGGKILSDHELNHYEKQIEALINPREND